MARQLVGEQLLAERERLVLVHLVEPRAPPRVLRGVSTMNVLVLLVERIRVRLEEPVLGLAKTNVNASSTWSVPNQTYLQPCGSTRARRSPPRSVRRTRLFTPSAPTTRSASGSSLSLDLVLEAQVDAQLARPPLQDLEQPRARDRRERVAARADQLAPR